MPNGYLPAEMDTAATPMICCDAYKLVLFQFLLTDKRLHRPTFTCFVEVRAGSYFRVINAYYITYRTERQTIPNNIILK